jgi:hypothetical protein
MLRVFATEREKPKGQRSGSDRRLARGFCGGRALSVPLWKLYRTGGRWQMFLSYYQFRLQGYI